MSPEKERDSMISPVIAKIISMQQSFTVSENEIAQYVMNNANTVVTSTITAIAKNTDTSEASINRFCKKIGYKGFNSFKVALAQGSFFNSMQAVEAAGQDSLVASISRDYSSMLLNTTAMLDENQVLKAAKALAQAHLYFLQFPHCPRRKRSGIPAWNGRNLCQSCHRYRRYTHLRKLCHQRRFCYCNSAQPADKGFLQCHHRL